MSDFMQIETESANGALEVTTELGETFYVSAYDATLTDGEYDVSDYRPEMVTGAVASIVTLTRGYLARLSAPGYLDCTDWEYGTDKRELTRRVKGC